MALYDLFEQPQHLKVIDQGVSIIDFKHIEMNPSIETVVELKIMLIDIFSVPLRLELIQQGIFGSLNHDK
jgi:hypothetical protein